jgi:hypothetical protein
MDENELAALAREHAARALKALAEVADSPTALPSVREFARRELEARLVQLRDLAANSNLPSDVRRDVEDTLRNFMHS